MDAASLLPGDFVQARMRGATSPNMPDQWLVTEFTVTSVTGTVVAGSVLYPTGLDQTAGWGFELITRNLTLPATLCEITATLTDGRTLTLMGKGSLWNDTATGERIAVDQIVSFTPVP